MGRGWGGCGVGVAGVGAGRGARTAGLAGIGWGLGVQREGVTGMGDAGTTGLRDQGGHNVTGGTEELVALGECWEELRRDTSGSRGQRGTRQQQGHRGHQ